MKLIKGSAMTYTALAVTFLSFAVLIALTIAHQKSEPANPRMIIRKEFTLSVNIPLTEASGLTPSPQRC